MRVLFIDNLDSFTFNLVHCLEVAGADVEVLRNEGEDWPHLAEKMAECDAWAVGPGPGRPQDYPHLMRAIQQYMGKKPLLGICLGQQAIAQVCGWQIEHAHFPMHGKPSLIEHQGTGLFESLPQHVQVGRYHSLVVLEPAATDAVLASIAPHPSENKPKNRPSLHVDARCDGEVMALSNPALGVWAVQFHPESVLTPEGQLMINRWVSLAANFCVTSSKA